MKTTDIGKLDSTQKLEAVVNSLYQFFISLHKQSQN